MNFDKDDRRLWRGKRFNGRQRKNDCRKEGANVDSELSLLAAGEENPGRWFDKMVRYLNKVSRDVWNWKPEFRNVFPPTIMKTNVDVRPALPKDIPTILDFISQLALFEKCREKVLATHESLARTLGLESEEGDNSISATQLLPGQFAKCMIAYVDGKEAGFAVFFYNYSTVCTLFSILIASGYLPQVYI
jgi:hypothetical protein